MVEEHVVSREMYITLSLYVRTEVEGLSKERSLYSGGRDLGMHQFIRLWGVL